MTGFRKSLGSVFILGLALAAAPVGLNGQITLMSKTALAAAGGNGGGGGGGGGNGGNGGGGGSGGNGGGGGGAAGDHGNSADHSNAGDHGAANGGGHGNSGNAGNSGSSAGFDSNGRGAKGSASQGQLASASGALNAAHASPNALAHAAPGSRVGQIATYDRLMRSALAMPANTQAEIAARNAAIGAARTQLSTATNKTLTGPVISQVDRRLGLPAVSPSIDFTPY